MPEEVREATADYREESDRVGAFLELRCEKHPMGRIPSGHLFKEFRAWCESRGETPGPQNVFGSEVRAHGCGAMKSGSERYYTGIRYRGQSADDGHMSGARAADEADRDDWGGSAS